MSVNAVSGGKVWEPGNPAKYKKQYLIISAVSAVIFLWVYSRYFFGYTSTYDSVMTLEIWEQAYSDRITQFMSSIFTPLLVIMAFIVAVAFRNKWLMVSLGVLLATVVSSMVIFAPSVKHDVIDVWAEQEYGYEILGEIGYDDPLIVKDIVTGQEAKVTPHTIDDVVYLATDKEDLAQQLKTDTPN